MASYYLVYGVMCVALGGFVIFVFCKMVERKTPFSKYLIPLAAYLILWQSWVYPRFDLLPESLWDSPLSEIYWYAHDGVLMLLMGIALLPLILKSPDDSTADLSLPDWNEEGSVPGYEQVNAGEF